MADVIVGIMTDAARAALSATSLMGDDKDTSVSLLVRAAMMNPAIQRKFAYSLSDVACIAGDAKTANVWPGDEKSQSTILPSLQLPRVTRIRQRKMNLRVSHLMSSAAVQFFNENYANDINFEFTHNLVHDHPVAAASRKVETEVVMTMLRARGADFTSVPTNGYDFSVIDCGGDWRYHNVRNHHGVHIDAPFLDIRDAARDAKKRMQMTSDPINDEYVCREKSEHCNASAPFMMSIHSWGYTTSILTMCEAMAARGTLLQIGSMHLPEHLETQVGQYVDPHYEYIVRTLPRRVGTTGVYVPPHARQGVGKYLFNNETDLVQFKYPAGESREYVHERSIITEKLRPSTYMVTTAHGELYTYKYRIVKRVGSLAYFEIEYQSDIVPAHQCAMATVHNKPFDGYQVTFDANMLHDYVLRPFQDMTVNIPRQLFTAVAAYCLVQVKNPSFSIEAAVSYAGSAASGIEANGVTIHKASNVDSGSLTIVTGAAAFFWAFDRMRLMEQRMPQLALADAREEVQKSIVGRVGSTVGLGALMRSMKETASAIAKDSITSYIVQRTTSYGDIRAMYESIATIGSPGLSGIRDLHECYASMSIMRAEGPHVAKHLSTSVVEAMVPVYPTYDYPPTKQVAKLRQLSRDEKAKNVDLEKYATPLGVVPVVEQDKATGGIIYDENPRAVVSTTREEDGSVKIVRHIPEPVVNAVPYIRDMINLNMASEAERDQSALQSYKHIFNESERRIISMQVIRGIMKGAPTVLHYVMGDLHIIETLEKVYHKGEVTFDEYMKQLVGHRCIYPEKVGESIQFGTGVVKYDGALMSDRRARTSGQTFDAVVDPTIQIRNADLLKKLMELTTHGDMLIDISKNVLRNEVAGSGKTHSQCLKYQEFLKNPPGQRAAIFSSTRKAAQQAKARLKAWGVEVQPNTIETVDSYLMNKDTYDKPQRFALVMLDEALQMHSGVPMAIQQLTGAVIEGYGDRQQIQYIPFTRFAKPAVVTDYVWSLEYQNSVTRRIPGGKILQWLQHPQFYGADFVTMNPKPEGLVFFAQMNSFIDSISVKTAYNIMGLGDYEPLMIMVYLREELSILRAKLRLSRDLPAVGEDGKYIDKYPACLCSVGESQGEDIPNALLLMPSPIEQPIYRKKDQTIVAWTRHKSKFGCLKVSSPFPSLMEDVAGMPMQVASFADLCTRRNRFE